MVQSKPCYTWLFALVLVYLSAPDARGQDAKPLPAEEAGQTALEEQDKPQDPPERTIEEQVADLNAEIQKKQAELQKAQSDLRDKQRKERDSQPLPGVEEVRAASLPDSPTREQVVEYLSVLRDACADRNRRSTSHTVVSKLKAVPKQYIDLLIDEYSSQSSLSWYVSYAMSEDDNDAIRKRITQTLYQYPNNINLVIAHGWCGDAKDAIKKVVATGELPGDGNWQQTNWWFQAAVELQDPATYPKLHELAVKSDQWETYIEMLAILPDYDLKHTINTCIARQSKDSNRGHQVFMSHGYMRGHSGSMSVETAQLAAQLGNVKGLGVLVNAIPESGDYALRSNWNTAEPRLKVLRFIQFRGSNDQIKAWYEQHKNKLVFDHLRQQFLLPETDTSEADRVETIDTEPAEATQATPDPPADAEALTP